MHKCPQAAQKYILLASSLSDTGERHYSMKKCLFLLPNVFSVNHPIRYPAFPGLERVNNDALIYFFNPMHDLTDPCDIPLIHFPLNWRAVFQSLLIWKSFCSPNHFWFLSLSFQFSYILLRCSENILTPYSKDKTDES